MADRGELSPDEAFALLGNETRFSILQALWDAPDHEASFSELRAAVGLADSGQFNYHLGKLVGPFVTRTDDGYRLRVAGERVVGAILSGIYTRDTTVEAVPVAGSCPDCGGSIAVRYADELAAVDCLDCEERTAQFPVPVGLLDSYDREEVPTAVDAWFRVLLRQVTAGVCPICTGRLDASINDPTADDHGDNGDDSDPGDDGDDGDGDDAAGGSGDGDVLHGTYSCVRCDERVVSALGGFLLEHPAVVAFLYDHGVDTRDQPFWTFEWLFDPGTTELLENPRRARLTVPAPDSDARLVLTVDDDLDVTDATRA